VIVHMGDTVGGRYALDGRLGEGGMGQVYRARHLQLGKAFALKLISPAFALDQAARTRFNQEARLASEITHPNIVSVVDFGEDAELGAYMVMELVEGEPLTSLAGQPMAVRRACDILFQIADALDHIHQRGIIHGDVKADNIMLAPETMGTRRRRIARLLDFGLARSPESADDDHASGSPHYLAPERAAGGPPSVAADVYALGVVGYLLLTGTLPFDGNVVEILMAHISQTPESPSARRKERIDDALEALVLRAMTKDPAKRVGSAAAFRAELAAVMDLLDVGRRRTAAGTLRPEVPREAMLAAAFERSRLPQALLTRDGTIVASNQALLRLLAQDDGAVDGLDVEQTTIGAVVPGLARALRSAHAEGKPCEHRARLLRGPDQPALELTVWLSPLRLPGAEIHMVIRVEDADGDDG